MNSVSVVEAARGFVLAGGLSTRMKRDKATLLFQGKPLIAHSLELLSSLTIQPSIVGARQDLSVYGPVVEDRQLGIGPIGGLEAALHLTESEFNLFIPVDLPFLSARTLSLLLERARITEAFATIPIIQGIPQPLAAVYRRSVLPFFRRAIEKKDFKVIRALTHGLLPPRMADFFHIENMFLDGNPWLYQQFRNLNHPEDLLAMRTFESRFKV